MFFFSFETQGTVVDPPDSVVVEATEVDLLQESLATLVKGCGRSTGTLMNCLNSRRTSTRSTQMSHTEQL